MPPRRRRRLLLAAAAACRPSPSPTLSLHPPRSADDKLAFAVHAFLLADGFRLVATGAAAEDEAADWAAPRDEVGPGGWDALQGAYAFRYQDIEGTCWQVVGG